MLQFSLCYARYMLSALSAVAFRHDLIPLDPPRG